MLVPGMRGCLHLGCREGMTCSPAESQGRVTLARGCWGFTPLDWTEQSQGSVCRAFELSLPSPSPAAPSSLILCPQGPATELESLSPPLLTQKDAGVWTPPSTVTWELPPGRTRQDQALAGLTHFVASAQGGQPCAVRCPVAESSRFMYCVWFSS